MSSSSDLLPTHCVLHCGLVSSCTSWGVVTDFMGRRAEGVGPTYKGNLPILCHLACYPASALCSWVETEFQHGKNFDFLRT